MKKEFRLVSMERRKRVVCACEWESSTAPGNKALIALITPPRLRPCCRERCLAPLRLPPQSFLRGVIVALSVVYVLLQSYLHKQHYSNNRSSYTKVEIATASTRLSTKMGSGSFTNEIRHNGTENNKHSLYHNSKESNVVVPVGAFPLLQRPDQSQISNSDLMNNFDTSIDWNGHVLSGDAQASFLSNRQQRGRT